MTVYPRRTGRPSTNPSQLAGNKESQSGERMKHFSNIKGAAKFNFEIIIPVKTNKQISSY